MRQRAVIEWTDGYRRHEGYLQEGKSKCGRAYGYINDREWQVEIDQVEIPFAPECESIRMSGYHPNDTDTAKALCQKWVDRILCQMA